MASASDSTLEFFSKATPAQWSYIFSQYKEALKAKAAKRTKKGGPDELIRMDNWYQEQLPKLIHSRKEPHITHEELVQITKWKLMREKYRPNLTDLVRINTERAVIQNSEKAFKRLPNLSGAIGALTNLKGVGPATASAVLAAGYPDLAPFMADECMLATPGVETLDYTIAEYLNYAHQLKKRCDYLNEIDSSGKWDPHKVELALWAHFVASQLKPAILADLPPPEDVPKSSNGKNEGNVSHADSPNSEESRTRRRAVPQDEDSVDSIENQSSGDAVIDNSFSEDSNSQSIFERNQRESDLEPPAKKTRV